jgi:hypothetical protein
VLLLLLKVTLTPLIIGAATLAARRWGPTVGGWIVSLPLTSGPVIFFIALDHGPAFAASASIGTLVGLGILGGWSLAYVAVARRGPATAVTTAAATFAGLGLLAQIILDAPFLLLSAGALAMVAVAVRVIPPGRSTRSLVPHPGWDLPSRVIVGTTLVVGLTTVAPLLGAHLSGMLATYPVYVSVLAVFTHLRDGPTAAVDVIRGLLKGLFGTITFYIVLHPALLVAGVGPSFLAAIGVALAVQAVAWQTIRNGAVQPA